MFTYTFYEEDDTSAWPNNQLNLLTTYKRIEDQFWMQYTLRYYYVEFHGCQKRRQLNVVVINGCCCY